MKNPYLKIFIELYKIKKDKEEKFVNWDYNRLMNKTVMKEVFYYKNLKGDL